MQEFRSAVESGDADRMVALLAADVVFRSPVVYAPYHGRATVGPLLRAAVEVFKDFRYTRQLGSPDRADHALVFSARVGEREVEGCDFLHVNGERMIDELYVMVRPLSAAVAVSEAMKRQLTLLASGAAPMPR
jgi:hypothetical protein